MGKLVLVRDCSSHGVVLAEEHNVPKRLDFAEALNIVTSRLNKMPKYCI
jgi:hypothetical protein